MTDNTASPITTAGFLVKDRVIHDTLGAGYVLEIKPQSLRVSFDSGIKIVYPEFGTVRRSRK